eukprot:2005230-Amphidinium_carterae.1
MGTATMTTVPNEKGVTWEILSYIILRLWRASSASACSSTLFGSHLTRCSAHDKKTSNVLLPATQQGVQLDTSKSEYNRHKNYRHSDIDITKRSFGQTL